ncbi:MAG: hypothetical protein AB1758_37525, partial [Candidatus Eremiobacterota bacterium]
MVAGRPLEYWREQLRHARVSVRLYAQRALARLGDGERLASAGDLPFLAWAVARSGNPLGLARLRSRDLLRGTLARFLGSLKARPRQVRRSRQECLRALQSATHPLAAYSCAHRLVELHGEAAIPCLLSCLTREKLAGASAWALGRLGRACLAESLEAYRRGSDRVRNGVLKALWYLGRDARGAEEVISVDLDRLPLVEAVLLAMESFGSPALLRALRDADRPVWLDRASVDELALLAFSEGDPVRGRAIKAMAGFGDDRLRAVKALAALCRDPDSGVWGPAMRALVETGERSAAREILDLLQVAEKRPETRRAIELLVEGGLPILLREALQEPEQRHVAAAQILEFLPVCEELPHVLEALPSLSPAQRARMLERVAFLEHRAREHLPALLPWLKDPD